MRIAVIGYKAETVISMFSKTLDSDGQPLRPRLSACEDMVRLALRLDDYPSALNAYNALIQTRARFMSLSPSAIERLFGGVEPHEQSMVHVLQLVVANTLEEKDIELAVELLDQGCMPLLSQLARGSTIQESLQAVADCTAGDGEEKSKSDGSSSTSRRISKFLDRASSKFKAKRQVFTS